MIEEILDTKQYIKNVVTCERNVNVMPPRVIVLTAGVAKIVLDKDYSKEYSYRRIQNTSGTDIYISYGSSIPTAASYHKKLADGQELAIGHSEEVQAFCVGAGTVATDVSVRTQIGAPQVNP